MCRKSEGMRIIHCVIWEHSEGDRPASKPSQGFLNHLQVLDVYMGRVGVGVMEMGNKMGKSYRNGRS